MHHTIKHQAVCNLKETPRSPQKQLWSPPWSPSSCPLKHQDTCKPLTSLNLHIPFAWLDMDTPVELLRLQLHTEYGSNGAQGLHTHTHPCGLVPCVGLLWKNSFQFWIRSGCKSRSQEALWLFFSLISALVRPWDSLGGLKQATDTFFQPSDLPKGFNITWHSFPSHTDTAGKGSHITTLLSKYLPIIKHCCPLTCKWQPDGPVTACEDVSYYQETSQDLCNIIVAKHTEDISYRHILKRRNVPVSKGCGNNSQVERTSLHHKPANTRCSLLELGPSEKGHEKRSKGKDHLWRSSRYDCFKERIQMRVNSDSWDSVIQVRKDKMQIEK